MLQTTQSSDADDKAYGLWFDVFLDSTDIHERASRRNYYGPVLFRLPIAVLLRAQIGRVWVTRKNPTKWTRNVRKGRWFESAAELQSGFAAGEFGQMLVLRHCGGILRFEGKVDQVLVDNPQAKYKGVDLFSAAVGALRLAATLGGVETAIKKRKCGAKCSCVRTYRNDQSMMHRMFLPQG